MALYWLLLFVPWLAAIGDHRIVSAKNSDRPLSLGFKLYFVLLLLLVGLRHEVGGDWGNYLASIDVALEQSFLEAMVQVGDPAYNALTWLSAHAGAGVYGVNLVCALVFAFGLMVFCQNCPRPWLSMAVAVPYLVIVVAMGYTRQGVAIGLIMAGLVALDRGNLVRFAVWMLVAALFHKTALILIPMAIFAGRKNLAALVGVLIAAVLMFFLLVAEYVDTMVNNYVTDQYASSGAGIRVAMNALPAAILLIFRKRFGLTPEQKSFWTWMSLGALAFILLLAVSPSSTAVDRVALYWIPLQLFVWSRLPQAMGQRAGTQRIWIVVVLVYAFAVQFVWLFYADHSFAWLPYQFYPWVWLWS
jgi:hypothetical protein